MPKYRQALAATRHAFLSAAVLVGLCAPGFGQAVDEGQADVPPPDSPRVSRKVIDQSALVQAIKSAIIKDLVESGFLRDEIRHGIEAYYNEQRASEEQARAKRQAENEQNAQNVRRPSPADDHIFGAPDAVISLIEYSDFECPYCKHFHPTPKALVEKYAGKVNWVYRHFPLAFHNPGAQKQAEAAECAAEIGGNEAFWRLTDAIYERTTSNGEGFPLDKLGPLADELGLDRARFEACVASGKHAEPVQADLAEGASVGIRGTPGTILLNNQTGKVKLIAGAVPLPDFVVAIDELLAE